MTKKTTTRTGYMIVDSPGPNNTTYWGGGESGGWVNSVDDAHAYTTASAAREVIQASFAHIYSVSVQPIEVKESAEESEAPQAAENAS